MKHAGKKYFVFSFTISFLLLFIVNSNHPASSAEKKKTGGDESIEELKQEIAQLSELAYIRNFMVSSAERIGADDIKEFYADDIKTLLGMEMRFFYSFGKIHGYVVFKNSKNDFAIIGNSVLKLILFADVPSRSRTFHIQISKDAFRRLVLYRGDRIIAFPVEGIDYGKQKLEPGEKIKIQAECAHLKAQAEFVVY